MQPLLKRVLFFVILSYGLLAQAAVAMSYIEKNRHKVKCYVELEDRRSIISLWVIKHKRLSEHQSAIIGRRVLTQNSLNKLSIIKTHECVFASQHFTSAQARQLDSNTAR